MTRKVVYSSVAEAELAELYDYIAARKSPIVAKEYVDAILAEIRKLPERPFHGKDLEEFRPGMRKVGFRRRVDIIFTVTDDLVQIGHVLYGGRDYEAIIRADIEAAYDGE